MLAPYLEPEGIRMMLYRIKTGSRDSCVTRVSDSAAVKFARSMVWQISPGERILVYRGKRQIAEILRHGLFDDLRDAADRR